MATTSNLGWQLPAAGNNFVTDISNLATTLAAIDALIGGVKKAAILSAATTLTATQSGTFFKLNASSPATYTLPTPIGNGGCTFYFAVWSASQTINTPAGTIVSWLIPSGATISPPTGAIIELVSDNYNWIAKAVSGWTPATGDNSQRTATTAFVQAQLAATLASYSTTSAIYTQIINALGSATVGRMPPALEIGNSTGATPFIDFHSSNGSLVDYDARIIAGTGNGAVGGAGLSYTAASHTFNSTISVGSATLQTDGDMWLPFKGAYLSSVLSATLAASGVPEAYASNQSAGGVGSLVFAYTSTAVANIAYGGSIAGSYLYPTSLRLSGQSSATASTDNQSTALSGTWVCLGYQSNTASIRVGIYLRIS